jgi:UPF0271 protein
MISVDLNCDMGEGIGNDSSIMPFITSANIACGFHAGDPNTILETVRFAKQHKVAIGAHPSFPDKENFGRTPMQLSTGEVYDLVIEQIEIVDAVVKNLGAKLNHVKPHGALYNMAAVDKILSQTIVSAIQDYNPELILFGLANSIMIDTAKSSGLKYKQEVFADRTYQDNGTLTPRTQSNALIENKTECIDQVLEMVKSKHVITVSGKRIPIHADTVCIHGDGKHAVQFAKLLYARLREEGVTISNQ